MEEDEAEVEEEVVEKQDKKRDQVEEMEGE